MKEYTKPEIKIEEFDVNDVITDSIEEEPGLQTWGTNVKTVDAVNVFE